MLRWIPESLKLELGYDIARLRLMVDAGIVNRAMDYDAAFWPSFVEHDDCVIKATRFMRGNFEEWLGGLKGDRRAVEAELNLLRLLDCFECRDNRPTHDEIIWVARLIKKLWLAKLTSEFPNRQFIVSFSADADDSSHSWITFHQ